MPENLPTKTARWGIFTGLSVDGLGAEGLSTATGIGINALDAFVVDKLIKGWKPRQFAEGHLKSLFDKSQQES